MINYGSSGDHLYEYSGKASNISLSWTRREESEDTEENPVDKTLKTLSQRFIKSSEYSINI